MYYIWSIEHCAWWKPAKNGYTQNITMAGVYHYQEAMEIIERANIVSLNECIIPVGCVSEGS